MSRSVAGESGDEDSQQAAGTGIPRGSSGAASARESARESAGGASSPFSGAATVANRIPDGSRFRVVESDSHSSSSASPRPVGALPVSTTVRLLPFRCVYIIPALVATMRDQNQLQ